MKRAVLLVLLAVALNQRGEAQNPVAQILVKPENPRLVELIEHDPVDVDSRFTVEIQGQTKETKGQTKDKRTLQFTTITADDGIANLSFDPAEFTIESKKPKSVRVLVKDVEWPGLYEAQVLLESSDKSLKKTFKIFVDVRTKPQVVALQSDLQLNLVKCWWLGCWLTRAFVPEDSTLDRWPIELRNDSLRPVTIDPQARLRRNASEGVSPAFFLSPSGGQKPKVEIAGVGKYELNVVREQIQPGTYEGHLAFIARPKVQPGWVAGGTEADLVEKKDRAAAVRNQAEILVSAKVAVRAGIGLPLFLIFIGVLAGRLNRQISTPEAQARLKLMDRAYDLAPRIEGLRDEDAKQACARTLAEIHRDINDPTAANEQIAQAVLRLERKFRLLQDLEKLEEPDLSGAAEELIREARTLIAEGRLEEVKEKLKEIRAELDSPSVLESLGERRVAVQRARVEAMETEVTQARKAEESNGLPHIRWWHPARVTAWIAGTRVASARIRYFILQPLASLFLLLALVGYGVFLFYSGPDNSTFGAAGISDYFPLFLWGFSTDVLNKRLQDFSFTR